MWGLMRVRSLTIRLHSRSRMGRPSERRSPNSLRYRFASAAASKLGAKRILCILRDLPYLK